MSLAYCTVCKLETDHPELHQQCGPGMAMVYNFRKRRRRSNPAVIIALICALISLALIVSR